MQETKKVVSFFQQFERLVNYASVGSQATHMVAMPSNIRLPDAISVWSLIAMEGGVAGGAAAGIALLAALGLGVTVVPGLAFLAGKLVLDQARGSFKVNIIATVRAYQAEIEEGLGKREKALMELLEGCLSIEYHQTA